MMQVGISRVTLFESGQIDVYYDNGTSNSFEDRSQFDQFANAVDDPTNLQFAQQLLMVWWRLRDPSLQSPGMVVGKHITIDMAAPLLMEVSS